MPTLEQKIKEYDAIKRTKVPGDVLAVMEGVTEALRASGLGQGAFVTGDQFPDFALPDQHGVVRPLSHYLAEGPVVLNIYRGGWCPYCNLEMQALNIALPEFVKRGVTLLGLTPEMPTTAQDTLTANELAITVLSDEGNRVSASLGLVFELPEVLRPIYERFGIDIPASNGDDSFTLPVPATYILGQDRVARYHFVNVDYTQRAEPTQLIAELDRLAAAGML
ncbi:peroxiredoxin-like family protein [Aeromonas veronii]|uniref:thioredoxin-dependent peroxiredoxin n=1 Tax=Aeromonas veronii TaxID=654 RepID=A0A3A9IGQ6_AERVE|nr:peroxiredoxin-like family protein [Aeromonas veronii]MCD6618613.1 AhpC/TSA family protein [Aeromonas veronii]MCF5911404.1 AhpC/TSA family protein [Aeromonas veronii]QLH66273.1 AhpC/TSA family protein [Aeromonas veronii]RKJ90045.1 AhpC/TSA family protein [Aeromonas veronii]HDZ8846920.1 AhpC/TSA family protein [Aeromonas veronii]